MKKYAVVYNFGRNSLISNFNLTVRDMMSDDYVTIDIVEGNDVEEVFEMLNNNHPQSFVDIINKFSKTYDVHTSMSYGDVLVELGENKKFKYWQCISHGWMILK